MPNFANNLKLALLLWIASINAKADFHMAEFSIHGVNPEQVELHDSKLKIVLEEYNALKPPVLQLNSTPTFGSCYFNGKPCDKSGYLVLQKTHPNSVEKFKLNLIKAGKVQTYTIQVLPDDFPNFSLSGRSKSSRPIIFSSMPFDSSLNSCHLIVLKSSGEVRFYRKLHNNCIDFRPHKAGNEVYYSYLRINGYFKGSTVLGDRVILDSEFTPIFEVKDLDCHEFILLSRSHWIQITAFLDRFDDQHMFVNREIREVSDGKVLFQWTLKDYFHQYPQAIYPHASVVTALGQPAMELIHLNSIQIVGSDELLIGLGDSGVALLNKNTRKIEWILGGYNDNFGIAEAQWFSLSHTPFFSPLDGRIILFANRAAGRFHDLDTRILDFHLDIQNKKVVDFSSTEAGFVNSYVVGSVQNEGSSLLTIGYGLHFDKGADIVELENFKETWSLSMENKAAYIYRIYRMSMGD